MRPNTIWNEEQLTSYIAFVIYDWLINLDEEIRLFWHFREGGRPTVAALFYGVSRYSTIVTQVLQLQTVFPISDVVRIRCHIPPFQ